MSDSFILQGDILYSESPSGIRAVRDGFLVVEKGICQGVFETLPATAAHTEVTDYRGRLIIPGMTDLHLHAPQYAFRGMWMDEELLDWLNRHTFPIEARYADAQFAGEAYAQFRDAIRRSATTRAVMFATIHRDTTVQLMDLMEETGIISYVGKVNMDRNSPDILREENAAKSLADTVLWLDETEGRYTHTHPILTPRFVPSCSDELMEGLGRLSYERGLPVQSHLSENVGEIAWVKELCPWSAHYGDAYDRYGLLGSGAKSVMAHCVHSSEEELQLMKARGTFIAHCPDSNANIASGIAPVRHYLDEGLHVGLGTDVAGGATLSMFAVMREAVQHSKLRWRLKDDSLRWLTFAEAFYMATVGGGAFFGRVGSFARGYEADILVLDDHALKTPLMSELTLPERLERVIYLGHSTCILHKYVRGAQLF